MFSIKHIFFFSVVAVALFQLVKVTFTDIKNEQNIKDKDKDKDKDSKSCFEQTGCKQGESKEKGTPKENGEESTFCICDKVDNGYYLDEEMRVRKCKKQENCEKEKNKKKGGEQEPCVEDEGIYYYHCNCSKSEDDYIEDGLIFEDNEEYNNETTLEGWAIYDGHFPDEDEKNNFSDNLVKKLEQCVPCDSCDGIKGKVTAALTLSHDDIYDTIHVSYKIKLEDGFGAALLKIIIGNINPENMEMNIGGEDVVPKLYLSDIIKGIEGYNDNETFDKDISKLEEHDQGGKPEISIDFDDELNDLDSETAIDPNENNVKFTEVVDNTGMMSMAMENR